MRFSRGIVPVICLFFLNNAVANTELVKNLKDRVNPVWYNKETLKSNIQATAQKSGQNPYLLSFPVAASAQLGEESEYQRYVSPMVAALDQMPITQNSLRSWLYGRALFAADSIGDKNRREKVRAKLTALLKDPMTAQDRFSTWAWGYLASIDKKSYVEMKPQLESALKQLAIDPQATKADKLWAWLMAAHVSANANDFSFYHTALDSIKEIAHEATVANALSKGLTRTATMNDLPAWGIAVAMLAAATVQDEKLYQELQQPFAVALQGAKDVAAVGEEMLAEVNAELAWMRHGN